MYTDQGATERWAALGGAGAARGLVRTGGRLAAARATWGSGGALGTVGRSGTWAGVSKGAWVWLGGAAAWAENFQNYTGEAGTITKAILVGPNQGGKTRAGVRKVLSLLRGEGHPHKEGNAFKGIHGWAVGHSAKQTLAVQALVYKMLPKHWSIDLDYNESRGFLNKRLVIQHVSGDTSTLEFKTAGEDALGLASATLGLVWCDEPHLQEHHDELMARVMVENGYFIVTATMINRPVEYLREIVETGPWTKHHTTKARDGVDDLWETYQTEWQYTRFTLHPENCRHLTKKQIDGIKKTYLKATYNQRVLGLWDGAHSERMISGFDPTVHVTNIVRKGSGWRYGVGIDHGVLPGSQVFILIAWRDLGGRTVDLRILDEWVPTTTTTPDMDAEGLLEMLERNALNVSDLTMIVGDVNNAGKGEAGRSMNFVLASAIAKADARRQGLREGAPPFIQTPTKGPGSIEWGCRIINWLFAEGTAQCDVACVAVRKSLTYWQGTDAGKDKALKHAMDAVRYIVSEAVGPAAARWGIVQYDNAA